MDGLRGLAALYVLLFHVRLSLTVQPNIGNIPAWLQYTTAWMQPGYYCVGVFILLSGYCLMLPVARSADGTLRGGVKDYLVRRARRILPPYYAALILSFLAIQLFVVYLGLHDEWWEQWLPASTPGVVGSHLLLVHNLSEAWRYKVNGALWSVAAEWQIYFLFPLLLLPIWKRFGPRVLFFGTLLLTASPLASLGGLHDLRLWYVGLFSLGMAGAVVGFSPKHKIQNWRDSRNWGGRAAAIYGLFVLLWMSELFGFTRGFWKQMRLIEILLGFATISLIIFCARAETVRLPRRPAVLRFLSHPWTVGLGHFSYSLYLIHGPVLGLLRALTRSAHLPGPTALAVMFFVGVPLSLVSGYLFHLAVERRFMPGHLANRRAVVAAAVSPAPTATV